MNNAVIACLSGSTADLSVCEYAAWAATTLGAPLALLPVLPDTQDPALHAFTGSAAVSLAGQLEKINKERQRLRLALAQAQLAECASWLKQRGYDGAPLPPEQGLSTALTEKLTEARLLVFGQDSTQHPVGSACETLIRLHRGAVLAAPTLFKEPARVMFAYDASIACRTHLANLTASPLLYGMECHLVMVNGNATALQHAFEAWHKAGIRVQARMLEGSSVIESLCGYAQTHHIDLTVMGAYGHSPRRRYVIGRHAAGMLFRRALPLLLLR